MDEILRALEQLRNRLRGYGLLHGKRDIRAFVIHDNEYFPHNKVIDFYGWKVLIVRIETSSFTVGISDYKVRQVNEHGELEWFIVPNVSFDYRRSDEQKMDEITLAPFRVFIAQPYLIMSFNLTTKESTNDNES